MELRNERDGANLRIYISGAITAATAPELEAILGDNLDDIDEVVFDLSNLDYTSSAGLRAFLGAQQIMDEKDGKMTVRGANDVVMNIFKDTGFDKLLDLEF